MQNLKAKKKKIKRRHAITNHNARTRSSTLCLRLLYLRELFCCCCTAAASVQLYYKKYTCMHLLLSKEKKIVKDNKAAVVHTTTYISTEFSLFKKKTKQKKIEIKPDT